MSSNITPHPRRVLLIGWDAAEWQIAGPLLQRGWMPHLKSLIDRGISGPIRANPPLLSPLLWTSIVTGAEPMRHGVLSRVEMSPDGSALQLTQRPARNTPAIWELLESQGIPASALNFPASHPADPLTGICVSDYFADPAARPMCAPESDPSVWPPDARDALQKLRISASEIDAASLLSFIPRAAEIDFQKDPRPGLLSHVLAQTATVHAAVTTALAQDDWRFAAACYMGIGQISQAFMPYHPPAAQAIPARDCQLYQDVVTGAYRFHDLMLGRILELIGTDTGDDTLILLVSNHGYRSDARRPIAPPATDRELMSWCSPQAMGVLCGPGVTQGSLPPEANLRDIAPTLLAVFGLQKTDLMTGVAWKQAPLAPVLRPIDYTGPKIHQPPQSPAAADASPSVDFLKSLGYIEQEDPHATLAAQSLELERQHMVALSWIAAKKPAHALRILEHITQNRPARIDYQISLAQVYAGTGELKKFRALAEKLSRVYPSSPLAAAAMGIVETLSDEPAKALQWLEKARLLGDSSPAWLISELGRAYLRLEQWDAARSMFEQAILGDDQIAEAFAGLSAVQLHTGQLHTAAASARQAAELQPLSPEIQFQLGRTLLATEEFYAARVALETALQANPESIDVIQSTAEACEKLQDLPAARALRQRAFQLESHRRIKRGPAFDRVSHNRG